MKFEIAAIKEISDKAPTLYVPGQLQGMIFASNFYRLNKFYPTHSLLFVIDTHLGT